MIAFRAPALRAPIKIRQKNGREQWGEPPPTPRAWHHLQVRVLDVAGEGDREMRMIRRLRGGLGTQRPPTRRLSVVRTRRGLAMMALIPWRRINRSMRPRLAPRP